MITAKEIPDEYDRKKYKRDAAMRPNNVNKAHYFAEAIGNCCRCNNFVKETWKFCPSCGQSIDWSDDNDKRRSNKANTLCTDKLQQ